MSTERAFVGYSQLGVSLATLVVLVGLGAKFVLGGGAAPDSARSPIESLRNSSYAQAEAAHITVTNDGHATTWACFKAVISAHGGGSVASVPVCTGDIKPHSTVTIEAPFEIGAVAKLCPNEDSNSIRAVDWSKCSFTLDDEN